MSLSNSSTKPINIRRSIPWKWRELSLRNKIVITSLLIEVISIGVLAYFSFARAGLIVTSLSSRFEASVKEKTEAELTHIVQAESKKADLFFSTTRDSLVKMADLRSQLEAQNAILGQGAYWDANTKLSQLADGQYGNPATDPASVFLPSTMTVDDKVLEELNTSAYLDFFAPGILETQPQIVAVYYMSALGSTTYYPNINLATIVPSDFDILSQPFFTIADPKNNPERLPRWTDPYQDPAGTGLIVTASAPVYNAKGEFIGVVGIDMQLARISENLSQIKIGKTGFVFLVDQTGRILAMPSEGYALFGLQPEEVPVNESPKETILGQGSDELQAITLRMVNGETGLDTTVMDGIEMYLAYAPLETTGYHLGVIVPASELNTAIVTSRQEIQVETATSVQVAIFILIALLAGAVLLSVGISRVITAPLTRLTQVAEQITAGDISARASVEAQDETGTLAIAFNRMTDRLKEILSGSENKVAERTRNLKLATEVGRSISQVRELSKMLRDATELIRSQFDLYYVQVYLTNQANTNLSLLAGTGAVGTELVERGHQLPVNTASINGRAVVEKRPVVISDTASSATFRPNPLLPDTRSEMAMPLVVGENVVGVLDMQSEHSGALSDEALPAFEALAGQLAVAIQNANLLAETEQARLEVEKQAQRLVRAGWQDYLDAIHKPEQAGFVFEGNRVAPLNESELDAPPEGQAIEAPIALSGETLGSLVIEMSGESQTPQNTELVNIVARQVAQQIENIRLLESAERYRVQAEAITRRATVEGWKEYIESRPKTSLGYMYNLKEVVPAKGEPVTDENAISLPLKARDETIGKLAVMGIEPDNPEALELAGAVVERLGAHIENLRLLEETRRGQLELDKRARELASVAEISSASTRELDVQKMLAKVVFLTQRKFGLYHAHVFTFNEQARKLSIVACGWKEGDEHEGTHGTAVIPIDQEQSLVARAARDLKPVMVNDVRNDPAWLPNPLLPDTRSELSVPLLVGDQLLGVLDVQRDVINGFSEEDMAVQMTLAAQVATAMQNAYSFAQARQQAEREAMLNEISQKIQSATTVEAVLQIAARELGHALGAPLTVAQLGIKGGNGNN